LLVLGGITTAAASTGIIRTPAFGGLPGISKARTATPQLHLNFESGALGYPVTAHRGAHIGRAYAHGGRYGCRLDPWSTEDRRAFLEVDHAGFAQHMPWAVFSMYYRLGSLPYKRDQYMNLFEIGNTSHSVNRSQFTVFFRNGTLTCDFGYGETMAIAPPPKGPGKWHHIEAKVFFGGTRYVAHVRYDGGDIKTLTSSANKTPQSVKTLWVHYPNVAVDYTMDIDQILMTTSTSKPYWFF
jgi:hypothetical protein